MSKRNGSYWNYRVVRRKSPHALEQYEYSVRECWYDRGQSAGDVPDLWTGDAEAPTGETLDELRTSLEHMLKALSHAVLVEDDDRLSPLAADDERGPA